MEAVKLLVAHAALGHLLSVWGKYFVNGRSDDRMLNKFRCDGGKILPAAGRLLGELRSRPFGKSEGYQDFGSLCTTQVSPHASIIAGVPAEWQRAASLSILRGESRDVSLIGVENELSRVAEERLAAP